MSVRNTKNQDYDSIKPLQNKRGDGVQSSLKPIERLREEKESPSGDDLQQGYTSPFYRIAEKGVDEFDKNEPGNNRNKTPVVSEAKTELSYADQQRELKLKKLSDKDKKLLDSDNWLARHGHNLTYIGIFLFTFVVYFRPYDWIPAFSGFTSMAFVIAVLTLITYLPSQLAVEGNVTIFTTEIKCLLFISFWALLIMPIAKDPGMAWKEFSDNFVKIVLIFIVMANTLRTKARLSGLIWLSVAVGIMLSCQALYYYQMGVFKVEGYRVEVDLGGMFGNPNDTALHLVMFTPVVLIMGIISKNIFAKVICFIATGLMVAGNLVTQSRGGFLGLIAIYVMLTWKLSKKNRVAIFSISIILGLAVIVFAPGNYWVRILSIFVPGLDGVGSHDQRREILIQSIITTLRNPWGIGMGNFPIVSIRNLVSHNAYTQISAELGVLSLACYLIFMISPLRKLMAIERQMFAKQDFSWIYYLSIGIQTCIVGYMVSSFFVSVAYTWFIYYPIAYAICLRRIYKLQQEKNDEAVNIDSNLSNYFKLQRA